jgi:hypothetical protein
MPQKPDQKPDDPEQSKRFIDAAREAEADETEEGAIRAFKKVVRPKKRATNENPT